MVPPPPVREIRPFEASGIEDSKSKNHALLQKRPCTICTTFTGRVSCFLLLGVEWFSHFLWEPQARMAMCSNVGLGTFFESGSYIDGCLNNFFLLRFPRVSFCLGILFPQKMLRFEGGSYIYL